MSKRPQLQQILLSQVKFGAGGGVMLTMSQGQWNNLLQEAYDTGCTLLELNDQETPVAAYRKTMQ